MHVIGIRENLKPGWNLDCVGDRAATRGLGRLDDLAHDLAQIEASARGRLFMRRAISERRLTEKYRPVERRDEPGRESLSEWIGNGGEAVGDQLGGGQHVAQIVIDTWDR